MAVAKLNLLASSETSTERIGCYLAAQLSVGDCVVLSGSLGAGKTAMCRGVAQGLGISEVLSSPTYLLCHEYKHEIPLLHLDAYFQARMDGILADGLIERFAESVVLIEWGEQIKEWLPNEYLQISLTVDKTHPEHRFFEIMAVGELFVAKIQRMKCAIQNDANSQGIEILEKV